MCDGARDEYEGDNEEQVTEGKHCGGGFGGVGWVRVESGQVGRVNGSDMPRKGSNLIDND